MVSMKTPPKKPAGRQGRTAYGPERHEMVVQLGLMLKDLREEAGYSTRGLAEIAKVPQSTVIRYEQGEREPRIFNLVRIAKALDALDRFGDFLVKSADSLESN
jgi:transcriptional regulator with XRE-family HTH domain